MSESEYVGWNESMLHDRAACISCLGQHIEKLNEDWNYLPLAKVILAAARARNLTAMLSLEGISAEILAVRLDSLSELRRLLRPFGLDVHLTWTRIAS